MRGHSSPYVRNCDHGDFLNVNASISFAPISVQQYAHCEIRSVIGFIVVKVKTPIEVFRILEIVYVEGVMS